MQSLAPIVLFCYNRIDHLQKTVNALKANRLSEESTLIIYSDGYKGATDRVPVKRVQAYARSISGFKNVEIHASDVNQGLAKSVIHGVGEVLGRFGKAIVLEDDIVTAPDFLEMMNDLLNSFESRNDIFSVTGFAPQIDMPSSYSKDFYLAPRASSWGWGTWHDRWQKVDWTASTFNKISKSPVLIEAFKSGGEDLWPMLVKQQRGVIDSWAVRWSLAHTLNAAYGVYPVRTKVVNIGTDGSGTNFNFSTDKYNDELYLNHLSLESSLRPDVKVIEAFKTSYKLPFLLKVKNFVKFRVI